MALGKNRGSVSKRGNWNSLKENLLEFGTSTRAIGRKRVLSSCLEMASRTPPGNSGVTKRRSRRSTMESRLESLPQDILVQVLCGVDHEDLKQLCVVSKTLSEAALIAKQWHFAFSTPRKIPGVRSFCDDDGDKFDNLETPFAPRQQRRLGARINSKKLGDISMCLFASEEEGETGRRDLSGGFESVW